MQTITLNGTDTGYNNINAKINFTLETGSILK